MNIGIEAINAYCGAACIDVRTLFSERKLDLSRFDNLMMKKKSVSLPCEDPVTNAVNAAKPIIDCLDNTNRNNIDLLITATESGIDFGKSLSTYVHDYLNLSPQCRLFEIKQACYGGTAALQMAINTIATNINPAAKALIIATDTARAVARNSYAEPSQGTAAVAMIISRDPEIFEVDIGAYGLHSYEVMDTCRPSAELEIGDNDLSLLSYLDCFEKSYEAYTNKISNVDIEHTFNYLVFHTPFGGMVKGAHRKLMRQLKKYPPDTIEYDFKKRIEPSLRYCMEIGNVYSATIYLALCSLIDSINLTTPKRVGMFSYGSGCSSEFFSGIITPKSINKLKIMRLSQKIKGRYLLNMDEYDSIINMNEKQLPGVENMNIDTSRFKEIYSTYTAKNNILTLNKITNYHREYIWSNDK